MDGALSPNAPARPVPPGLGECPSAGPPMFQPASRSSRGKGLGRGSFVCVLSMVRSREGRQEESNP